jgi:hypothetical protein
LKKKKWKSPSIIKGKGSKKPHMPKPEETCGDGGNESKAVINVKHLKLYSYTKNQQKPPSKKKRRGKNLSPRNR